MYHIVRRAAGYFVAGVVGALLTTNPPNFQYRTVQGEARRRTRACWHRHTVELCRNAETSRNVDTDRAVVEGASGRERRRQGRSGIATADEGCRRGCRKGRRLDDHRGAALSALLSRLPPLRHGHRPR